MHHTHPHIKTYDNYPQITSLRTRTIGSFRPSGKAKKQKQKQEMNKLRLNGVSRSQMNEVSVHQKAIKLKYESSACFPSGPEHSLETLLSHAPDLHLWKRLIELCWCLMGFHQITNRKLSEKDPNLPRPSLSQQAAVSESVIISSISLFHSFRQTTISCLSNQAFTTIWDRAGRHDSIKYVNSTDFAILWYCRYILINVLDCSTYVIFTWQWQETWSK